MLSLSWHVTPPRSGVYYIRRMSLGLPPSNQVSY